MTISKRLRRYRGWIALGVLVAVGGTTYALTRPAADAAAKVTYTTGTAEIGTLSVTVAGTGNLTVDGTTDVYPDISGTVASIKVAEGDAVTKGDVLFTLSADSAEAATAKALASYRQSQQSVAQASASLLKSKNALSDLEDRADEPSSTVTSADITAAKAEVTAASASVTSSKASQTVSSLEYEQVKDAEDDLVVTAPTSGIIYTLNIEVGDSVQTSGGSTSSAGADTAGTSTSSSSSAPVVISPKQPLALQLTVNEVDLPTLEVGQRADVAFDALPDVTATGKVYDIDDAGLSTSGVVTFKVWISIDVADERLRSGMSSAATIVTDVVKDALLVPNAAVKSDGNGGYYVQVLDASGVPQKVTVETGEASSTQTQILSGISEGAEVVTASSSATSSTTNSSGGGLFNMGGGGGAPRG
jgi:multidrug efflux pump subunit AcrA (membrane-fusion protein)